MKAKYDYSKLKGRIRERYGRQDGFAKAVNLSPTSVSHKLNNLTEWTQEDIRKAAEVLNIGSNEIPIYFFAQEVQKTEPECF